MSKLTLSATWRKGYKVNAEFKENFYGKLENVEFPFSIVVFPVVGQSHKHGLFSKKQFGEFEMIMNTSLL